MSKYIYNYKYYRTLKWKKSVDESVSFYEDGHIPAILVQNKVDLLPEEEQDNMDELNDFSQKNGFTGCFRTSAKTGKNIAESMEFLIKEIIKRLEEINAKGGENFNKDRQSVALDPDKHNKEADAKRKKDGGGCC
jgi:50S ribosomal subunit-associated GTPase HflX